MDKIRSIIFAKEKSAIRETIETILLAAILAFLIRSFIIEPYKVEGRSMEPTLYNNERLFINKFLYRFGEPRQGDIIVFRAPIALKKNFIKRVIAVPGDTIEIRKGIVYVDGKRLEEPYIESRSYDYIKPRVVPEGSVFVLGDNRNNSSDSRSWSFLPIKNIKGKSFVIWWPPSKIKLIR